jgi:prevent-host-death family protein
MKDEVKEVSVSTARRGFADLVNETAIRGRTIYLTNRGRRIAALVPVTVAEDNTPTTDSTG